MRNFEGVTRERTHRSTKDRPFGNCQIVRRSGAERCSGTVQARAKALNVLNNSLLTCHLLVRRENRLILDTNVGWDWST